jgi:hypothetical protein
MTYNSSAVRDAVSRIKLSIIEDETPTTPGAILAFDSSCDESAFATVIEVDDPEFYDEELGTSLPDRADDENDPTGFDEDGVASPTPPGSTDLENRAAALPRGGVGTLDIDPLNAGTPSTPAVDLAAETPDRAHEAKIKAVAPLRPLPPPKRKDS